MLLSRLATTRRLTRLSCHSRQQTNSHREKPVIITLAITGSKFTSLLIGKGDVAEKKRTIAVPISPEEQIESAHEAFDAGARVVHLHVRDQNGIPTWDADTYGSRSFSSANPSGKVQEGLKKHCPDLLVEFSLGNYAPSIDVRLALTPLTCGRIACLA